MLNSIRKVTGLLEVAHKYSTFLFDLDGVVWSGDEMIEPNVQAIRQLNAQNKRIMFISNSSAKGRLHIWNKLTDFQIKVPQENVYNSTTSTALYLRRHHPTIRKLLVIGSENLLKELRVDSLETVECPTQGSTTIQDFKQMINNIDTSIDAVVVGVDYSINFGKVALASLYIQMGRPLFATNKDQSILIAGYKLPGAGSCVTPIEFASGTKATVVGKPNPFILEHIIETYGLKKEECLMVGDNLQTDIEFAQNAGVDSLLTMTGVTSWK